MAIKPHALAAEALGTFLLTLAVSVSLANGTPLSTAVVAGLTLGLVVYMLGPVSGAHVNPAVTIGLLSIKKISMQAAIGYVVAQCVGALLAMFVSQILSGGAVPSMTVASDPMTAIAEAIGAAVLVLGVSSVVHGKTPHDASGLTIGGSLLLGIMLASAASNGVVNPAVALGIGSVSISYILGPIIGGVIAAWLYRDLAAKS